MKKVVAGSEWPCIYGQNETKGAKLNMTERKSRTELLIHYASYIMLGMTLGIIADSLLKTDNILGMIIGGCLGTVYAIIKKQIISKREKEN